MTRVVARRLSITGRVQGVGFREAVVRAAREAGVDGWVRNRFDGSVETLVQGRPDAVERVVGWCRRGPALARVVSVEVAAVEPDASISGFDRRPTA